MPVFRAPVIMVADSHVLDKPRAVVGLLHRDGQRDWAIGRIDDATVAVSLLMIALPHLN